MTAATIATGKAPAAGEEGGKKDKKEKKGGKKKLILILVPLLLGGGFAAKTFLLAKPKKAAATAEAGAPQPGAVATLDPITINLSDGHYLRLGLALQLAKGVDKSAFDGSAALDAAIGQLSGGSEAKLSTLAGRTSAKQQLTATVTGLKAYKGKVLSVYFTDFVMQ